MKAYHIMLFLFIFNMFFWVITAGIAIYEVEYSTDEGFDLSGDTNPSIWTSLGVLGGVTLFGSLYSSIGLLGAALAAGAMIGIFKSGQASQGIVYGAFTYFFWSGMGNTFTALYSMVKGPYAIGALYILTIFGMIIAVVFIVGLFQMATGGWKSYE